MTITSQPPATLRDEGYRFYCAPVGCDCKWMTPVCQGHVRPGWVDMTDVSGDELAGFLMTALASEAAA